MKKELSEQEKQERAAVGEEVNSFFNNHPGLVGHYDAYKIKESLIDLIIELKKGKHNGDFGKRVQEELKHYRFESITDKGSIINFLFNKAEGEK